jgi:hypothetical protein
MKMKVILVEGIGELGDVGTRKAIKRHTRDSVLNH